MRAVLTLRTMTLLGFFITLVTGSASLTAAFDSVDKKYINKNVDPNSPVSKMHECTCKTKSLFSSMYQLRRSSYLLEIENQVFPLPVIF